MTSRLDILVKASDDYDPKFVISQLREMADKIENGYVLPNFQLFTKEDEPGKLATKHERKISFVSKVSKEKET